MKSLRRTLLRLWKRRQLERDLDDELRFHLEMAADQSSPPEARRRFGNTTSIRETCRDMWGFGRLETWWQDVRYALRSFRRRPAFALVAVVALALGIGADTAMFTIVKGALLWNMGLDHAGRVMIVNSSDPTRGLDFGTSYPDFLDLRQRAKSFEAIAAYQFAPVNLSDGSGLPERYYCARISANGNRAVGQKPILGRDFTEEDEKPGAPPVALIGHHVWQQRYGSDAAIVGRIIRLNEVPTQIVGVMPPERRFPEDTDLWTALVPTPLLEKRDNRDLLAYGTLHNGVTPAAARAELDTLVRSLAAQYPETNHGMRGNVRPIAEITGVYTMRPLFAVLFAAVGFVLLIACADVANMLLARAAGRAREISVRIAIGAGRVRIIRQLLIESTMLSVAGGVLGWFVAIGGLRWFDAGTGDLAKPVWLHLHLDTTAYLYLAAISVATGVLFGLAPALRLARIDIHNSLKDGGYGTVSGRRSLRLAGGLVAFEMALCVILLVSAGLMIRSATRLYSTPIGVNLSNVLTMRINLPEAKYPRPADIVAFHADLWRHVAALPGVQSAAAVSHLPLGGSNQYFYQLDGDPARDSYPRLKAVVASPEYFQVSQIHPRHGRLFSGEDAVSGGVVVNETFARKTWPDGDAIGKRLRLVRDRVPQDWLTVVGVIPDILQNFQHPLEHEPILYLPFQEAPQRMAFLEVRTALAPGTLAKAVRSEVQHIDENLAVYDVRVLENFIAEKRITVGLFSSICTVFAAIALLLASIGLYSVTAHSVSQRMQEFGIRLAMGGTTNDILRLVFRQCLRPLAFGMAAGLPLAVVMANLLRAALSGVSPWDPVTFIGVIGVLAVAGVVGCAVPARRAMRVDPVVILRCE